MEKSKGILLRPWEVCTSSGHAYLLLRNDLQEHLKRAKREIGFKYLRFHGIFHADVGIYKEDSSGAAVYRWHQVDKIYDTLLAMGIRPFVELAFMPRDLASGSQTMFFWKGNVTPPKSYERWGELIYSFTQHMVERYGLEEVCHWYFEVWNEPNLKGFWSGEIKDYFRLYEYAARAIKRVNNRLRVGGPATARTAWIPQFLKYCKETNIPIDFVTTHLYPQDEYCLYEVGKSPYPEGHFFAEKIRKVKQEIEASSFPNLELHISEWNALHWAKQRGARWLDNPDNDAAFSAPFIVKSCLELRKVCNSMSYWTVSDIFEENGLHHEPFHCGYGLLNIHGIPKSNYNAFLLLKRLGIVEISLEVQGNSPPHCGAFATRDKDAVQIILWNFHAHGQIDPHTWEDTLYLDTAFKDEIVVERLLLAPGIGSPYETWQAMGCPSNLDRQQITALRYASHPQQSVDCYRGDKKGIEISVKVPSHGVVFYEIRPKRLARLPEMEKSAEELDAKLGE